MAGGDFRCWIDHYRLTSYVVNPHLPLEELHCCPVQGHQKTEYVWSLLSKSTQNSSFPHNCIPLTVIYVQCYLHRLYQYVGNATSIKWGATATLSPTPHAVMPCQGLSLGHSWSVNTTDTSKCYKSGFLTPRHKSQCLKLPAHRSTILCYCSFSTLCES